MSNDHDTRIDYEYKPKHRITISDTATDAFLTVAHPRSGLTNPQTATFTREQAKDLYEQLDEIFRGAQNCADCSNRTFGDNDRCYACRLSHEN